MKRSFDIVFSVLGLVSTLPLLVVIGIAIKIDDRGPIFYRGIRVGRYGDPFRMFKFRTMVLNADRIGGPSAAEDDPRITRLGKRLRKSKLDELPQLLNVLKGDMSIVGPRPEVQQYVDMFRAKDDCILSVRPGITDWASLWNRDEGQLLTGAADPEKAYLEKIRPTKIRLQLKYVEESSFRNDLLIILQTIKTMVRKEL